MECNRNNYSESTSTNSHSRNQINSFTSSGDDVLKLQKRLSLLREEYIKLQNRLSEVERQNSILLSSQNASDSSCNPASNNSFISKLLKAVAELINDDKYSDIKIHLAGNVDLEQNKKLNEICAHKFVLATRNESWGRSDLDMLDWTSVPYEIGFAIINWIYTNDTPVRLRNDNLSEKDTNENDSFVLTLMKSAKSFGLQDLMNRCEESLVARVQIRNCIRYYTTAEELKAEVLKDHCSQLISMHWDDFTFEDFSHMSAALLYDMFKQKTRYPLHFAIRMKREDVVFLYLIEFSQQLNIKLNEPDEKGCLTLDLALSTRQEDLALNLIEHKVQIDKQDSNGFTALHNAIMRGDAASALFLLNHRADVNILDLKNNTALHLVLTTKSENMLEVCDRLLERGAQLDVQDSNMMTPLHLSIKNSNTSIFELLLKKADKYLLEIKDVNGLPPMWYALEKLQESDETRIHDEIYEPEYFASELIKAGASPNSICDSEGNSLLHDFSSKGCERAVEFLIDCVSNKMDRNIVICNNSMNVYGETPLHAAAKGKLGNVAKILLNQGANPNIQTYANKRRNSLGEEHLQNDRSCNVTRQTPLHIAVTNNDYDFVKSFLTSASSNIKSCDHDNQINFTLQDSSGKTALGLAIENRNFDIAEELLKGGADVNETNTEGESLLQQSINHNNHEASSFLIVSGGADVNLRSNKGVTCIELAIQMKMCNVIELLCQFGADMSLSSNQYPPLWTALAQEEEEANEDIPAILVRHGVDTDIWVEGPDQCEQTLLHKAIDENRISAAVFLIRAGCDLDSPRRPGPSGTGGDEARDLATPLHLCCQWGIDQVVETLLEHGAAINSKDVEGKTPLHSAIEAGNQSVAEKLIQQNGIDLCTRDKSGLSPFACAMTYKNQKAAQKILQLEPSAADQLDSRGRNFLHTAILKDDLEAVLFLISVHANVNTKTQDPSSLSGGNGNGGLTPLMLAVSKGNTMIIRNLILAGSSVADLTPGGQTALQVAAENGLAEVCSILLSNGVDFSVADNRGNNALHSAVKEGHLDVTRILLTESSINAEACNNKGRNPLHILANFGRPETSVEIFQLFMECMPEYPLNQSDAEGNTALLLAYMKGNGGLCRALVKSGLVALGTLNNAEISIFNCAVASKALLSRILDYLSIEPKWGEGDLCQECKQKFGITTRKHHCRHCGRLLCSKCSDKEMPIIKYGISKPARVCDICSDVLTLGIGPQ